MKKIFLLLAVLIASISCKDNKETVVTEEKETTTLQEELQKKDRNKVTYEGEFIYVKKDNAAVLKTERSIYGINLNGKAMELIKRVEAVKKDEYDMVPVHVGGTLNANRGKKEGEDGWDKILTIEEIFEVSESPAPADIKIEEKKS